MKHGSTLFLRCAVIGIGGIVLLLGTLLGRGVYNEWPHQFPTLIEMRYLAVAVIATVVGSFCAALYQAMKLLGYIDKSTVFSKMSVDALKKVKYAAILMGGALAAGMPIVYLIAQEDDAPGLILFGMAFVGAPIAVAVGVAVGQRLLQNVIDIKSENDLTV